MKPKTDYSAKDWYHFLRKTDSELLQCCRMDIYKATGKGGQKKNKTSNAIRLTLAHLVTAESRSRSRAENISGALKKLRLTIALDTEDALNTRNKFQNFSPEIVEYTKSGLIRINSKNPLFPIFIGNFIDAYISCVGDWKALAELFSTTPSQLRKFSQKNPFMLETVRSLDRVLETLRSVDRLFS